MNEPVDEQDWIPIDDLVDNCYTVFLSEYESADQFERAMRDAVGSNLEDRTQSWSFTNPNWSQHTLEQIRSVDEGSYIEEQISTYRNVIQDAKKIRGILESKMGRLPI